MTARPYGKLEIGHRGRQRSPRTLANLRAERCYVYVSVNARPRNLTLPTDNARDLIDREPTPTVRSLDVFFEYISVNARAKTTLAARLKKSCVFCRDWHLVVENVAPIRHEAGYISVEAK